MTFPGLVAQDNADSAAAVRHSVWNRRWKPWCHPLATPNCLLFMRLLPCWAFSIILGASRTAYGCQWKARASCDARASIKSGI